MHVSPRGSREPKLAAPIAGLYRRHVDGMSTIEVRVRNRIGAVSSRQAATVAVRIQQGHSALIEYASRYGTTHLGHEKSIDKTARVAALSDIHKRLQHP
jgi:hypothetical protein